MRKREEETVSHTAKIAVRSKEQLKQLAQHLCLPLRQVEEDAIDSYYQRILGYLLAMSVGEQELAQEREEYMV